MGLFLDQRSAQTGLAVALDAARVRARRLAQPRLLLPVRARAQARRGAVRHGRDALAAAPRRLEAILALSDTAAARCATSRRWWTSPPAPSRRRSPSRSARSTCYDEDEDVFHTRAALGGNDAYNEVHPRHAHPRAHRARGVLREEFRHGNVLLHRPHALRVDGGGDCSTSRPTSLEVRVRRAGFHPDDALFVPLLDADGELLGLFDLYDPEDGLRAVGRDVAGARDLRQRDGERTRERALRGRARGAGGHRRAHRAVQPPSLPGDAGGEVERAAALRARVLAADDGPRPLQERQRPPRPPARRRGAQGGGRRRARQRARRRTSRPGTAGRSS